MKRQLFAAFLIGLAISFTPAVVDAQELPPLASASRYLPNEPYDQNYITPAQGILTSGYGWRWGRMHEGLDIAAEVGTPVVAAASGIVEYAGFNEGGYGNMIDIRHPDGSLTRYAHLNSIAVHTSDQVEQGQPIGEVGSTGNSTGSHLHFEIHLPHQRAVDPIGYLPSRRETAVGLNEESREL